MKTRKMDGKHKFIDTILINAMIIHPYYGSEFGFPWQWLLCLAENKHLKIEVISGIHEDNVEVIESYLKENQIHNLKFHFIPFPKVVKFNLAGRERAPLLSSQTTFKYWIWYWKAYKLAKKITKDRKVDLLHQLNPIGFRLPGFLGLLKKPFIWGPIGAGEQFNLKFFSHLNKKGQIYYLAYNTVNFLQWRLFPFTNYCFRRADALIASTSELQHMLYNKFGVRKNDVFHIPETGAIAKNLVKSPKSKEKGKLSIAVVCYFQHRKNLPLLFDALSQISPESVEVKICGEGPSDNYFRSYATRLDLKNVEFLGWKKKHVAREVIESSDVLVMPTLREANTNVIFEGLAAATPVICVETSGMKDIIQDHYNGFQVKANSNRSIMVNELVAHINYMINCEKSEFERLSIGALETARNNTYENRIIDLLPIYMHAYEHYHNLN